MLNILARDKHSNLFALNVNDDEKFYNIDIIDECLKTFNQN